MLLRQKCIGRKLSWSCQLILRRACSKIRKKKSSKFADSLNLPQTSFPITMKNGIAAEREIEIQKACGFADLYSWQRRTEREEFVLHDGPPYANGNPHVGHAINKILKDITNRYRLLRGYKVHYVPGWDCHGLPIELKALEKYRMNITGDKVEPQDVRAKARKFAEEAIQHQSNAFQRWGVMADWNEGCYYTFDKEYEAKQIQLFYQMYEKGFVYQDYMPVYWSPSTRTALAEAELEYDPVFVSKSIYLKFPLTRVPPVLQSSLSTNQEVNALVWTTTPWTIPANKAICYSENISYCLAKCSKPGQVFLFAVELLKNISEILNTTFDVIAQFQGSALQGGKYAHPLSSEELPFLPAHHVTTTKGTGLVHNAPAHGHDDFKVAQKHGVSVDCIVNEEGMYTKEAGQELYGKEVLGEGNLHVIKLLEPYLCHVEEYKHSYPIDWRSKKPVIIRASQQWFINVEMIRDQALESFQEVCVFPKSFEKGMMAQLESRSHWCISRQRVWGVPIPVFYKQGTNEIILNSHTTQHLANLVNKHGTDCWWNLPINELLPPSILEQCGLDPNAEYRKGQDILDIWFDSGSSWLCAFQDKPRQADLYLEGTDQFRGWFQSSLLLSVAMTGKPPYRNLMVHGFTVDEEGKKMSKSLGNVVDPHLVINGGKDKKKNPSYGADVLRWWAARWHTQNVVEIGPSILEDCNETIYKLRKTLRFLLGNLYDFENEETVITDLLPQDKYMLHQLYNFASKVTSSYDEFNYHSVLVLLEKFVNTEIAEYFVIVKDRLYCDHADSTTRRSGQMVLHHILDVLTKTCAPVLPHIAEEVYLNRYEHSQCESATSEMSVFKGSWSSTNPEWINKNIDAKFKVLYKIREAFYREISSHDPVGFDVTVSASDNLLQMLKSLQPDPVSFHSPVTEVLQCSCTTIQGASPSTVISGDSKVFQGEIRIEDYFPNTETYSLAVVSSVNHRCERCRRQTAEKPGRPCQRCMDVLEMGWDM